MLQFSQLLNEFTTPRAPVGVGLIAHGLNARPDKMRSFVELLNRHHLHVLAVALSGHRPNTDIGAVTSDLWKSEMREAFAAASKRAMDFGVPLYFLGFSLGGLLGLSAIHSVPELRVQRCVLLAPALKVRIRLGVLETMKRIPQFIIPSFSPRAYRYGPGTSGAGYGAVYDLLKESENWDWQRLNVPTLVMADPADELVDVKGFAHLIEQHALTAWKFLPVEDSRQKFLKFRHLILDENTLGTAAWRRMQTDIADWFAV